jgi:hypothetical protein
MCFMLLILPMLCNDIVSFPHLSHSSFHQHHQVSIPQCMSSPLSHPKSLFSYAWSKISLIHLLVPMMCLLVLNLSMSLYVLKCQLLAISPWRIMHDCHGQRNEGDHAKKNKTGDVEEIDQSRLYHCQDQLFTEWYSSITGDTRDGRIDTGGDALVSRI